MPLTMMPMNARRSILTKIVMVAAINMITIAVPRSGWLTIKRNGTRVNATGVTSPFNVIPLSFAYFE